MDKKILNKIMQEKKLDVVISFADQTRYWFTKVKSSYGFLFIEKDEANLFVDSRYILLAKQVAENCKNNLLTKKNIQNFIFKKNNSYKRIGFESDYATIDEYEKIKKWFPNSELISINGQFLRQTKTKKEIKNIKTAAQIGLRCFEELKEYIVPGVTEKELAAKLEYLFKVAGAEKQSFDTIVASGINGAKPHAVPSNKKIENGEFVTFDFGTYYNGYASDTTRTIQVGEVKNPKLLEIYKIVEEAQKLGIEAIKPGITGSEIDKICRDYIIEKGYGEYFGHGTGHGLGIDIHELPNTNGSNNNPLEPGNVVTVEPGIYIEGLGGVRIEDDILVTENGFEVISSIK
ncbi:MAG: aminopeptidase P family protein [Mycoplasma sp.]|nr:aminopeptidase P family protein [Mycoplasma sp.]